MRRCDRPTRVGSGNVCYNCITHGRVPGGLMAKKRQRRRKPGLQRCSICGAYQLAAELERRICMNCLGLIAVKRWRPKDARPGGPGNNGEPDAAEKAVAEAVS